MWRLYRSRIKANLLQFFNKIFQNWDNIFHLVHFTYMNSSPAEVAYPNIKCQRKCRNLQQNPSNHQFKWKQMFPQLSLKRVTASSSEEIVIVFFKMEETIIYSWFIVYIKVFINQSQPEKGWKPTKWGSARFWLLCMNLSGFSTPGRFTGNNW